MFIQSSKPVASEVEARETFTPAIANAFLFVFAACARIPVACSFDKCGTTAQVNAATYVVWDKTYSEFMLQLADQYSDDTALRALFAEGSAYRTEFLDSACNTIPAGSAFYQELLLDAIMSLEPKLAVAYCMLVADAGTFVDAGIGDFSKYLEVDAAAQKEIVSNFLDELMDMTPWNSVVRVNGHVLLHVQSVF